MRRFLFAAAAVFSLTSLAHAKDDMIRGVLTACNTPEAMEAFTKHVLVDGEDARKVLDELGDLCKVTYRVFEPGPSIKNWIDIMHGEQQKYHYSIVPIAVQIEGIAVADGIMIMVPKVETLFAITYQAMMFKELGKDSGAEL